MTTEGQVLTQEQALAQQQSNALAYRHELSVEEVLARVKKVKQVMREAMEEGVHYGKIPGTDKPTLLKPGAELLDLIFRLDPQYQSVEQWEENGHLIIKSICTLWHIPTQQRMGSGEGSCSTRETKYAFRYAKRTCPKCHAEQLNRSKFPPRDKSLGTEPGWYCHAKGGGCGAEFGATDAAVTGQVVGLVPNPNLADTYNTVLKMANKRSLIAAVLNVTAASDVFTQDLEEMAENEAVQQGKEAPATKLVGTPQPAPATPPQTNGQQGAGDGTITEPQTKRFLAIARGTQPTPWDEEQITKLLVKHGYAVGKDLFHTVLGITKAEYNSLVTLLKDGPEKGLAE